MELPPVPPETWIKDAEGILRHLTANCPLEVLHDWVGVLAGCQALATVRLLEAYLQFGKRESDEPAAN